MPALYNMTITTKGLNLRARAEAEELVLQFTKVAIGNGDYDGSEDLMPLTDLKSKKQELGINSKTYEENTISLKTVVSNTDLTEGYYIKEIGVYAQDPDEGEILYSISVEMDDKWDYLPAEEWGPASIQYSLDTAISNADQVEIKPGSGAYALAEDLEAIQNPEFEDYEGETALPEMETALGQIKSGNGLTKILQYIKAALRILDEREVDMSPYDQAIQELIEMDDQQNEDIGNLQNQMASFEATKSDIVSSSLGQAIGLTASSIWSQVVEKIKAVVNRGALNWSGSNTTKTIDAGYYSGGTLDSRPSYNNGYNAGVTAADNRSNPNSTNYKTGYNAGVNVGKMTNWSSKSVTVMTCASGQQVNGTRYPGGHGSGDTEKMCWVQFNIGVSKVLAIRVSVEATGEYAAVVWWHCGYPNRVVMTRGNTSNSAGAEVAIGSGTSFWVNGTNAKIPVNQYNYDKYFSKTCNITIWYA